MGVLFGSDGDVPGTLGCQASSVRKNEMIRLPDRQLLTEAVHFNFDLRRADSPFKKLVSIILYESTDELRLSE